MQFDNSCAQFPPIARNRTPIVNPKLSQKITTHTSHLCFYDFLWKNFLKGAMWPPETALIKMLTNRINCILNKFTNKNLKHQENSLYSIVYTGLPQKDNIYNYIFIILAISAKYIYSMYSWILTQRCYTHTMSRIYIKRLTYISIEYPVLK